MTDLSKLAQETAERWLRLNAPVYHDSHTPSLTQEITHALNLAVEQQRAHLIKALSNETRTTQSPHEPNSPEAAAVEGNMAQREAQARLEEAHQWLMSEGLEVIGRKTWRRERIAALQRGAGRKES